MSAHALWIYLAFLVPATVAVILVADWDDRPAGVLGVVVSLSIGIAFVLGAQVAA